MRKISVKLFWFRTSGPGADVVERYFLFRALWPTFSAEPNHFCNFDR